MWIFILRVSNLERKKMPFTIYSPFFYFAHPLFWITSYTHSPHLFRPPIYLFQKNHPTLVYPIKLPSNKSHIFPIYPSNTVPFEFDQTILMLISPLHSHHVISPCLRKRDTVMTMLRPTRFFFHKCFGFVLHTIVWMARDCEGCILAYALGHFMHCASRLGFSIKKSEVANWRSGMLD